jgi:hypothetical protein
VRIPRLPAQAKSSTLGPELTVAAAALAGPLCGLKQVGTAGPLHEQHGLLFADIEPARVAAAHRTLDVAGHYSRNDIFRLSINRRVSTPVAYEIYQTGTGHD